LSSTGHLFDRADALQHFVKHLPFGSTFNIIQESVLYSLSTTWTADQLLPFESVIERVMNVELNRVYFQPPSSHHPHSDTSTTTTPCFKGTTVTPSVPTSTSSSQSRSLHSGNFCTGC